MEQDPTKPILRIPTDRVELPTRGEYYPEYLNQDPVVTVETLVGQDEDLFNLRTLDNYPQFYISLLKRKVKDLKIPVEQLLQIDADFILFNLIRQSFGSKLTVPKTLNSEETIELDIDEDFEIVFPTEYDWDNENTTLVKLPMTGYEVRLGLLTIGDKAQAIKQSKANKGTNGFTINNIIYSKAIKDMKNSQGEMIKEKLDILTHINHLPLKDVRFIQNTLAEFEPRIEARKEITRGGGEGGSFFRSFGMDPVYFFQN